MRRGIIAAIVLVLGATVAHAAEWDTLRPGESTQAAVRERFGGPTKNTGQKIEGYDTSQWIYEGDQAPKGMTRVTIDFGMLTPQGYRADVIRVMRLDVLPEIFNRSTILAGWGAPEKLGREKDADVFFYESGLLVYFDKEGWLAQTLIFTPPQRPAASGAPPRR